MRAALDAALYSNQISEADWYERLGDAVAKLYLAADTPWGQSGRSSHWRLGRGLILDAVDFGGTFLDCGCANGYLMESVNAWGLEKGYLLEPYGVEILPKLAELAKWRLPHWSDRIYTGNILSWEPPRKFDYVRLCLEYVPPARRSALMQRLMMQACCRRIIVGPVAERIQDSRMEDELCELGYRVDGRSERLHPSGLIADRIVWIDVQSGSNS